VLVNGEDRVSPWASYVLQPPKEKQHFEGLLQFILFIVIEVFRSRVRKNRKFWASDPGNRLHGSVSFYKSAKHVKKPGFLQFCDFVTTFYLKKF
jgi:hypothetical protein